MVNVIGHEIKCRKLCNEISILDYPSYDTYVYAAIGMGQIYKDFIEKGYNLTIDDICDVLDVSENYVQRYILKYLDRIEFTKAARFGLKKIKNKSFSPEILDKKIIINRESFFDYLNRNLVKVNDSVTMKFDPEEFELSPKNLKSQIFDIVKNLKTQYSSNIKYNFSFSGEKFQSLENMKVRFGLRHDVQIYRIIEKYSFQKFKLNVNTVRYVLSDQDIERIILDDKRNVYHSTTQNIVYLNTVNERSDNKKNQNQIVVQLEKFILDDIINTSDPTLIKDNFKTYLNSILYSSSPLPEI